MIDYIYIGLIALPIALVSFNAAFWGGVYQCLCFSEKMRMALGFAIFSTLLFWLGGWTGNSFAKSVGWLGIPISEAILLLSAAKLIYGAVKVRPEQKSYNLTKWGELIAVAFATGLNAFMIGLGYGMLRPVAETSLYIIPLAVVAFSYAGDFLGKRNGKIIFTRSSGIVAGISVFALGLVLALDLYDVI